MASYAIKTPNPTLNEVAVALGLTYKETLRAVVKREVSVHNNRIPRRRVADVYFGSRP